MSGTDRSSLPGSLYVQAPVMFVDRPTLEGVIYHGWPRQWDPEQPAPLHADLLLRLTSATGPQILFPDPDGTLRLVGRMHMLVRSSRRVWLHGRAYVSEQEALALPYVRPQMDETLADTAPRWLSWGRRREVYSWRMPSVVLADKPLWAGLPPVTYWMDDEA